MLSVRFDLVIPTLGISFDPTKNVSTNLVALVFSVTYQVPIPNLNKQQLSDILEQRSTAEDERLLFLEFLKLVVSAHNNAGDNNKRYGAEESKISNPVVQLNVITQNDTSNSPGFVASALPVSSVTEHEHILVPIVADTVSEPKKLQAIELLKSVPVHDSESQPTKLAFKEPERILEHKIIPVVPGQKKSLASLLLEKDNLTLPQKSTSGVGDLSENEKSVPSVADSPQLSEPKLVCQVRKCITQNSDKTMSLCEDGVGGTYFVQKLKSGRKIAVFKPTDEEPGAPNNPKKTLANPLLPPGGGAKREVAAYLLDNGRAGVPETHFIENVKHSAMNGDLPKSGSIQRFVENEGDSTTMGSSRFAVTDVHNIGILDIRLFNMDRNGENILVQKKTDGYRLIPIDHTYILPPSLDSAWFEWHYWRQAKQPFSKDTLEFIEGINLDEDSKILRSAGVEESGIRTNRISTTLLKIAAKAGMNLFSIAEMVCRKKKDVPSELEGLVLRAEEESKNNGNFMEEFAKLTEEAVAKKGVAKSF